MSEKNKKIYTETLSLRLTDRERNRIEFEAERMGLTSSAYMRHLLNKQEFISNLNRL
jgi:predicted DNA-binding protein